MYYTVKELNEAIRKAKKKQFKEQESTGSLPDANSSASTEPKSTTKSNNNVTKWESGVTRGKANPIDSKSKWDSEIKRGKANPIDSKSKWESGVTRGKANPIN